MAPIASSSSPKPVDHDVPIEEIVFSCAICQATVSEVYATKESNQGFHSGSGDEDGIVTKMWITECSHVTCAKHLENGAAPFHPKGMAPKAPCPKCLKDKGDTTLKELYSIRGLEDGQYDPVIPAHWRQCPAVKLDNSIPGISAVRFQYMALVHYSREARKHWKSALQKQSAMEIAYSKECKHRRQLQSELEEVKKRVEALEQAEVKLKRWEERKPMINHYMTMFGKMARDIGDMRNQLLHFGVTVPKTEYAFVLPQARESDHPRDTNGEKENVPDRWTYDNASNAAPYAMEDSSSTRKRKREDYPVDGFNHADVPRQQPDGGNRDMMPPPLPRTKPHQGPTHNVTTSHAPPFKQQIPSSRASIQFYQDRNRTPVQRNQFREQSIVQNEQLHAGNGTQFRQPLPYSLSGAVDGELQDAVSMFSLNDAPDYYAGKRSIQSAAIHDREYESAPYFYRPDLPQQSSLHNAAYSHNRLMTELPISRDTQHGQPMSYASRQGHIEPNQYEQTRAPLQPLSQPHSNRQLQPATRAARSLGRASSRDASSTVQAPVASPFFRREGLMFRQPTMHQSATRGSTVQSRNDLQAHNSFGNYRATPTRYANEYNNHQARVPYATPIIENSVQGFNHRSSYKSPTHVLNTADRSYAVLPIPHTPRKSQGLFQRLNRPPPSASHTASQPFSNMSRSRVSLLPNNMSAVPLARSQDEALAMVPGVRGVTPPRDISSYPRAGPVYGAPRNLFSSAGGRRSVKR